MKNDNADDLNIAATVEAANKLKHDVMAPICNIKAYTNELKQVGTDIEDLLMLHKDVLPQSLIEELRAASSVDIDICTKALDRATESLETQLQVVLSNTSRS